MEKQNLSMLRKIIAQQKQQQNLIQKFSDLDNDNTLQGLKILQQLTPVDLTQEQKNQINSKIQKMKNPKINQHEILDGTFFNDKYLGNIYKNFDQFKLNHKKGDPETDKSHSPAHKITDATKDVAKGVYNTVANYLSGSK